MELSYIKIFLDFDKTTEALSEAELGRLLRAMLAYARQEEIPELRGGERVMFPAVKVQIDRDVKQLLEYSQIQSQNGKKGGRPKKATGFDENPKNPTVFSETQKSKDKDYDDEYIDDEDDEARTNECPELRNADLAACVVAYENNIGTISSFVGEKIALWLEEVEATLIIAAIKEAVNHNARSWAYIEAVLNNCSSRGTRTAEAFYAEQETQKQKKSVKPAGGRPQRDANPFMTKLGAENDKR